MIFGVLVALLVVVTVALIILPVIRQPAQLNESTRDQQNILIARDKKKVLEQQLADGQMTDEDYQAALQDLETSLAIDLERQRSLKDNRDAGRWAVWLFAAVIPVTSFYLYWQWGSYQVIENPALAMPRNQVAQQHAGGETPSIEELLDRLKNHLRENPDDAQGWFMLGRSYLTMQNFPQAVGALERSLELMPDESAIMLALADALAMTQNGNMQGRPGQLVERVLLQAPNEPTALWLAGLAAEQDGRARQAQEYWTRLLPLIEQDAASAQQVRGLLATLEQENPELAASASAAPSMASPEQPPAADGMVLSINLDPSLADRVSPGDLLFVYARAESGPPMPLAARRLTAGDLPLQVVLGDDDAMMPQMKLSAFDRVVVGARISGSGQALAQSGDLFVESQGFEHKTQQYPMSLTIDQIKP
jgi:cytochrome c-type biogenesis protein CcmH